MGCETQEHKDREIIQKAMLGMIELEQQRELQGISRQRDAKNRGKAIQMPPFHTTLVEVYREFARF